MKIRKVTFRSIYFEMLDFDWEEVNNEDDYEYFILESNKIDGTERKRIDTVSYRRK